MFERHKVFVSFHHKDQSFKDALIAYNNDHSIFIDKSVEIGDFDDELSDQYVRQEIRDQCLKDSTVTILLVGDETRNRKHVDWELYSSMVDGAVNKKSGILVVELPHVHNQCYNIVRPDEKAYLYPNLNNWVSVTERSEFESRHPYMPTRIIDNLTNSNSRITVVPWNKFGENSQIMARLIDGCHRDRQQAIYDLRLPMMERNRPTTAASRYLFNSLLRA